MQPVPTQSLAKIISSRNPEVPPTLPCEIAKVAVVSFRGTQAAERRSTWQIALKGPQPVCEIGFPGAVEKLGVLCSLARLV